MQSPVQLAPVAETSVLAAPIPGGGGPDAQPLVAAPPQPFPDLTEEYFLDRATPTYASARLRYQTFAREYVRDRNASRAARAAGYAESYAHLHGYRLLRNAYVVKLVQQITGEQLEAQKNEEERVRHTLTAIQEANLLDYFSLDEETGQPKLDLIGLTREQGLAIQSIKVNRFGELEVKLYSKTEAAKLMGQAHGLFTEKHEHTGPGGQALVPPVINIMFVAPKKEAA